MLLGKVVGAVDQREIGLVVAGGDLDQQHRQPQFVASLLDELVQVGIREGRKRRGSGFDHGILRSLFARQYKQAYRKKNKYIQAEVPRSFARAVEVKLKWEENRTQDVAAKYRKRTSADASG